MNQYELMMNFLREEGFCPKEDEFGIEFKFEGAVFLFIHDEDDEQFFRLMMPNIYDVTDENREVVMSAMNKVNFRVKVVKVISPVPHSVWVAFEVLLDSTPVLGDIVPRALNMLKAGRAAFYEAIQEA